MAAALGSLSLVVAACGELLGADPDVDLPPDASTDALAADAAEDTRRPCPDGGFCDDFDTDPFGETWTRRLAVGGGSLVRAGAPVRSPPSAFRAHTPALAGDGGGDPTRRAQLVKDFDLPSGRLRCAFSVRVEETNDDTDVLRIELGGADVSGSALWIDTRLADSQVHVDSTTSTAERFSPGVWVRVTIDIRSTTAEVRFDDAIVINAPTSYEVTQASLMLGLFTLALDAPPTTAFYDDLVCEGF
jgi:hypothetical protein